jgi:hypothetical protein
MKFKCISICLLLAFVCFAFAGHRFEITKVVKPDTVLTVKPDTTKIFKVDTLRSVRMDSSYSVKFDTLRITSYYRDTSVFVKQDTARISSKAFKLKKK